MGHARGPCDGRGRERDQAESEVPRMMGDELNLDLEVGAEEVQDLAPEATVPCEFTCGIAGSGKTFLWRERIAADPTAGLLMATTGISAVNLGTVTVRSEEHTSELQ